MNKNGFQSRVLADGDGEQHMAVRRGSRFKAQLHTLEEILVDLLSVILRNQHVG